MGTFGRSVNDVACLLDVLLPDQAFQSSLDNKSSSLAIGVSSERVSVITEEEESLFSEVQTCLASFIVKKDIRIPLHQEAKDQNCAGVLIGQALKGAWDAYFEDVDGPIRSLQDIVDWHLQHPVSHSRGTLAHILSESFHPDHPGQSLLEEALGPQSPLQLTQAKATVSQLKANFLSIMDLHNLDAIIYPWAGWAPLLAGLAKLPVVRSGICTADNSVPLHTS
jgi:hypothetical protein